MKLLIARLEDPGRHRPVPLRTLLLPHLQVEPLRRGTDIWEEDMKGNIKRIVLEGWTHKRANIKFMDEEVICLEIFKRKENKDKWELEDWPPLKVRLIVEVPE